MPNAKIFLMGDNETNLTPMIETPYAKEDILQVLLARYPDLLPGDQIDPEDPRRWLLVTREMGVPGAETETGRWSLDHLFLDQDGMPTFVECKRATDTRARREVVAQMLDYAANGIEYWSMDRLRQAATETAAKRGKSIDEEIRQLLEYVEDETEPDVEGFWQKVEKNLKNGNVRLIFVADETPKELRRLVEFLNDKMADVEVLAVEVKQFISADGQKAIAPRVIGLTESARTKKGAGSAGKRRTSRAEFLANCTPAAARFFERVLDQAGARGHTIYWGQVGFSIRARLPRQGRLASFIYGWPRDPERNWNAERFEFYFGYLPLSADQQATLRSELLGFGVFQEAGEKTLRATVEEETVDQLNQVYDLVLDKIDQIAKSG